MTSAVKPSGFPWLDLERASSSVALKAGASVYLSGVSALGFDSGGRAVIGGGLVEQSKLAYAKIAAALDAAGKSVGDAVKVVEYVVESALGHYRDAEGVRRETFGSHRPAVNTVVVKRLADPDALIAIEATASSAPASVPSGRWLPSASESDGVVYMPNLLALDDEGRIIAPGDLVGQTQAIFEKAARTLETLGLAMDRVVMTVDHLTPASRPDYKYTGKIREAFLGPVYPGAAGIVMPALPHPEALIQYEFTATREKPVRIDPGWSRYDALTYSAAVRAGKLLFMSGQGARNPLDGVMQAPGDVLAQCEYIYSKITKVIEAAGGSAANVVSLVEYVSPRALDRHAGIGEVRRRAFGAPYPVATSFACEALLRRDMEVEIVPFAILDWERR